MMEVVMELVSEVVDKKVDKYVDKNVDEKVDEKVDKEVVDDNLELLHISGRLAWRPIWFDNGWGFYSQGPSHVRTVCHQGFTWKQLKHLIANISFIESWKQERQIQIQWQSSVLDISHEIASIVSVKDNDPPAENTKQSLLDALHTNAILKHKTKVPTDEN